MYILIIYAKNYKHYVDANDNYLALDNEKHKEATNRSVRTATEQHLQCGCVFLFWLVVFAFYGLM